MNIFIAILAGAVQGLTEFLPISSTGHLIIFEKVMSLPQEQFGLTFDAALHLGTLFAVLIFFFRDYLRIFTFKNNLLVKLLIGTMPAAVIGFLFESYIETNTRSLAVVGCALIIFSVAIILAEKIGSQSKKREDLTVLKSLLIGISQAIALIPGVSRSASTICAGLFLGLNREEAAKFAFMLSAPIIAGAGFKKLFEVSTTGALSLNTAGAFVAGIASSFIFGYLTIKYFLKYLETKNLYPFVIYRVILGSVLILISLTLK